MKTQRRHELHTNVLADWLGRHLEKIQPIVGWIVAATAVIVLGLLAYSYFSGRSESQLLDGWTAASKFGTEATSAAERNDTPAFRDATGHLAKIVTDYAGTPLATFAEASLGDILLYRGQLLIWRNRAEALESLREAVTRYNAALDLTDDPLLKNRLRMNLGTTYEWMFQVEDAKRAYQKVEGIYRPAAEQAIAALEQATAAQLFERLEKYQPTPPATPQKPDTEFGKEGDDLFQRFSDLQGLDRVPGDTGAVAQPTGTATPPAEKAGAKTEPAAQDSAAEDSAPAK